MLLMNRRVREVSDAGWNEKLIDHRTTEMIRALLSTWPVPAGHKGAVAPRAVSQSAEVSLKDLVVVGLLVPGTVLRARSGSWGPAECTVLDNGDLELAGKRYRSPSGAAQQIRPGSTNGWQFWELPDGRRLSDLRTEVGQRSG